jgi:uncharacterized protein (DUF1684 family)
VWYDVSESYKVKARFVPYDPVRKISIVNVLDEVSDEPSPGYIEFKLKGKTYKLDVVGVRRRPLHDPQGRYRRQTHVRLGALPRHRAETVANGLRPDLNRAYNPPCAFSAFTTCPLPPKQNILKTKIEAGEKYPPRKAG